MVRDDDFDRRRASRQTELGIAVERALTAGRESLVQAEQKRAPTAPSGSGKQTAAQGLGAWTQGLAVARDPVAETELQVRTARAVIAKLTASQPQQKKQLESELCGYLESAAKTAALAVSRPNGREIAMTVLQLIAEAQSYLASTSARAKPADDTGSDVVAVAQRGVAGPGGRLPHYDVVQRAFGAHDLSGVRAHVGGAAADASRELGAQAYTHGDHIAFASEPTPQLVAHEATHVVQQQAGVSLKGIDGGTNDVHEQQANAVEHAVAQGQSVESMLSSFVGAGSRSATSHAVQRKGDKAEEAPLAHDKFSAKMDYELFKAENAGTSLTAPAFVHRHITELRRDIDVYLVSRDLATGVPEVTFTPDIGPFMTALFAGFDEDDNAAKVSRLRNWVAPADLYEIVDRNRAIFEVDKTKHAWSGDPNEALNYAQGRKGPPQYANAVAVGIGAALEERLLMSLTRVSQQLVVATARHRASGKDTPVAASELVPAHPLDWQVALAMVGRGTPTVHVADGAVPTSSTALAAYRKVQQVEWQGALGGPWNAVRIDPPDAGPEAVAAELLGGSTEAYRIQRVGPYFLIPEDQAVRFPQALLFHRAGQHDAVSDLAHGKNAATVERAEVERELPANAKAPTSAELTTQWQAVHDQLLGISAVVHPYGLDAELGLALSRHAVHAVDLASLSGHDAAVRAQLFTKQANLLDRVAAQVAALTASAPAPKAGPSSKALHDVLEKLVRVANLSHLPETGEAAMAEVVTAQRAAMPDALEAALGDIATQIEIAREVGGQARQAQHRSEGTYGASLAERANALRQRVAVFRSNMLRDKADSAELESLGRDVEALRFEAGVIAEVGQLGQLFEILDELEESNWVLLSEGVTSKIGDTSDDNRIGRLETARRGSMDLRRELNIIHGEWLDVEKTAQSMEANLAKGGVKDADAKARALVQPRIAAIQAKLKKLGGEEAVQAFLKDAYDKIDSAKTRAFIVQIATMIGVAALASATGGLAGGVAEGLGAGSLGVSMVSLTAETAMFTAVSARLSGEPMLAAFVNNGIGNLLTFGAMRGVGKVLEGTETVGWTLKMAKAGAKVRTAALAIAKAGELTAQTLVAQGIQIAQAEYESIRATGHAMSTHELELTAAQGMAMMIGTAISHRVLGDPSLVTHTLGTEIGARITKLRAMSNAVAGGGDAGQAVALMEQTRALVEDIGNRARELTGKNDHELASLGYTRQQVEALAKFAGTQSKALAAMDAGSFAAQLGLHTVVPGRVFSGGANEVEAVVKDFQSRGYAVARTGEGYQVTKKDESPIELFVRPDEAATAPDNARTTASAVPDHAMTRVAAGHARGADNEAQRPATPISGLDGNAIAAQVPGTTYEPGGTFVVTTARGSMAASIRRTTGAGRVTSDGHMITVEIPRGLKGPELERALVEQLGAARTLVESGRGHIDSEKGIAGGRKTFEDFAGGPVSDEAKARAHAATLTDNAMSLPEQAKQIATRSARSEQEMLASIAQGDVPRYVARVDAEESFLQYKTFGRWNREFIYATEPADLRGVSPARALEKVGWTKEWMQKLVNKEIAVCVFDTQASVKTATGERTTSVGKMAWDRLIDKALNDSNFVDLAMATAGVANRAELVTILGILERTSVRAQPNTRDPSLAAKAKAVAKLLDQHYSANDLFTGIGATMNTSGDLGVREVMVENNGTKFQLTPENHVLITIGKLNQEDVDALH